MAATMEEIHSLHTCTYSVEIDSLIEGADEGLLVDVVRNAEHVLRPHYPAVTLRRCNLRPRTHNMPNFCLPEKDDSNFIPRISNKSNQSSFNWQNTTTDTDAKVVYIIPMLLDERRTK